MEQQVSLEVISDKANDDMDENDSENGDEVITSMDQ